jgi:FtsP/CotA-like multicopper oxidase with cupredoxin domain
VHENSHFGDINMVSGIPFPLLNAPGKWQRFRLCNGAVSRPWLLTLVTNTGAEVASKHCYVIAGDGGYRRTPAPFPAPGLFMGVAERYEARWSDGFT